MKILELNHVAIHVEDVERSCEFYRKVLKLESIPRPAFNFPGAWFQLGELQELHIIGRPNKREIDFNPNNHYALLVDDIEAWEEYFEQNDIEYLPRRTRPDGAYQIYVTDPDGHHIELCTRPGVANH